MSVSLHFGRHWRRVRELHVNSQNELLPDIIWDLRPARLEVVLRGKLVNDTRALKLMRIHRGESRGGYSIRACLKTRFGVPPLGGFRTAPPKGGTPNLPCKWLGRAASAVSV